MNDVSVIDLFLDTYSRYIDSGFGLIHGEVAWLSATLIGIDMTLAGLYWALGHAAGQGDDVIAKLLRKTLYVGAFAYLIGNFNTLSAIVFNSFVGLGLTASGSTLSTGDFLHPGRIAKAGIDAGAPILQQISTLTGFPEVFINITPIVVMFLAWLIVILSFFILSVQLFVTLIEFKLTTLAGFVLIPFALWGKTAFLAEKVLGNVVSSGVKVLVLAVISGIGGGLFAQFQSTTMEPSIDNALVLMLTSLALLALGIFGPGVATGLISGGPQLGAGAMAGAALGASGATVAGVAGVAAAAGAVSAGTSAATSGATSAVAAGARLVPRAATSVSSAAQSGVAGAWKAAALASRASSGARTAFEAGYAGQSGGWAGAAAGVASVASAGLKAGATAAMKASAQVAGRGAAAGLLALRALRSSAAAAPTPTGHADPSSPAGGQGASQQPPPAWAKRLHRRQQIAHAATTLTHTLRAGDGGGSSGGPSLRDSDI